MEVTKSAQWAINAIAHFFLSVVVLTTLGCQTRPERWQLALRPGSGLARAIPVNQGTAHAALQQVLDEYVDAETRAVDYARLSSDGQGRGLLDIYLSYAADVPAWFEPPRDERERRERVAFLLNANQAAMLRVIVEFYPIDALDDMPVDFDDRIGFDIAGRCVSPAELTRWIHESDYPLVEFACFEPTVQGPPPLQEVVLAATLDRQLHAATIAYLHHPSGVKVDHENRRIEYGRVALAYEAFFIERYATLFREPYRTDRAILTTAIIPELDAMMQYRLANVVGYEIAESERNRRINDIEHQPSP